MITSMDDLAVKPLADEVIKAVTGRYEGDAEPDGPEGVIGWSNELALHVIELKTIEPVAELDPLPELFQQHVRRINAILAPHGARLMPAAMHPFMDPHREFRLWPHEYSRVYAAFDRIFGCQGHGWANLQSAHINLPFGNDEEFGRLHAAIRLVLPLLPALAASSPIVEGHPSGWLDSRLEAYRQNARRVPSVAGHVVPEPVFTRADYEREILGAMYRDIAPLDPQGLLRFEWLNARGCIARFERGSIEIRLLDIQECPLADLAIVALIVQVVRALTEQRWSSDAEQRHWAVEPLRDILLAAVTSGEAARIDDRRFLEAFGWIGGPCTAGRLWAHLAEALIPAGSRWTQPLSTILREGTLARRILRAVGPEARPESIAAVYARLRDCLETGAMFEP